MEDTTTDKSPFEVVYGFNPLSPLDILHLPLQERINLDASARETDLKKVHQDTRNTIERQVQRLATKLNKALYGLKQAPRAWYDTLKLMRT